MPDTEDTGLEPVQLPFDVPEQFTGLTLEQLADLEQQAYTHALPIRDKSATAPLEPTESALLTELAAVVEDIRAERDYRTAQAAEVAKASAIFAVDPTPAPAPAAPAAEPADDDKPADKPKGGATTRPRIADLEKDQMKLATDAVKQRVGDVNFTELVVAGVDAGPIQYTNWTDVAEATERQLARYGTGSPGVSSGRNAVAILKRPFSEDLRQGKPDRDSTDTTFLDHVRDDTRLPGGSLVAAAAWCAPSETVYSLSELETMAGMFDLPEGGINRGGIRFTPGPDFASIYNASGYFHQTETQVQAGTAKPCMSIDCPAFTDARLEVEGLCITGAILQTRGYPELVQRFQRGGMTAHGHKLNAFVLNQVEAGSTAVDLTATPDIPLDLSTTSNLLASVEIQAWDIRYRNRMDPGTLLEAVFPLWSKALVRADLSRRLGVDLIDVPDSRMIDWFNQRGIRPQFVYDWQDAFNPGPQGGTPVPGGSSPLLLWPNFLYFMIYPAGTWFRGSDPTIRLDTIYDSTKLATNEYTALFFEEGVLVAKVGNGASRRVKVAVSPTGQTASGLAYVAA